MLATLYIQWCIQQQCTMLWLITGQGPRRPTIGVLSVCYLVRQGGASQWKIFQWQTKWWTTSACIHAGVNEEDLVNFLRTEAVHNFLRRHHSTVFHEQYVSASTGPMKYNTTYLVVRLTSHIFSSRWNSSLVRFQCTMGKNWRAWNVSQNSIIALSICISGCRLVCTVV